MPKPHIRGKNAVMKPFIGPDGGLNIPIRSHKITREGTEHGEGVNGEQADRLDFSFTHYGLSIVAYVEDLAFVERLLGLQANEDAQAGQWVNAASATFYPRDGSRVLFACNGLVIDKWDLDAPGRTDPLIITIPGRFTELKKLP